MLRIKFAPFLVPGKLDVQHVSVDLNGTVLQTLLLREIAFKEFIMPLPTNALRSENILTFELPDAESPMNLGISEDRRRLGISVEWIELD